MESLLTPRFISCLLMYLALINHSDNSCRIAYGYRVGWYVVCNNRACSDDHIVAYGHSHQHDGTSVYPDIVAYGDRFCYAQSLFAPCRVHRMCNGIQSHIGTEPCVVADSYRCHVEYGDIIVGQEVIPHMDVAA